MKLALILPTSCDRLRAIIYERIDGVTVVELCETTGNAGRQGETLEALGVRVGRIITFKEGNDDFDARTIGPAPSVNGHGH